MGNSTRWWRLVGSQNMRGSHVVRSAFLCLFGCSCVLQCQDHEDQEHGEEKICRHCRQSCSRAGVVLTSTIHRHFYPTDCTLIRHRRDHDHDQVRLSALTSTINLFNPSGRLRPFRRECNSHSAHLSLLRISLHSLYSMMTDALIYRSYLMDVCLK